MASSSSSSGLTGESKGLVHSSSEPLLPVLLSSSSSLTTIVENPKDAAARSRAIDAQLAAERRNASSDCTVWVTAPGNGVDMLSRWLHTYVRVRTTASQVGMDVAWNDVWSSLPPSAPSQQSVTTSPLLSLTSLGGSNGYEHRRSLSQGSGAIQSSTNNPSIIISNGTSQPSSPLPPSTGSNASSPAVPMRRLSGAFSSTALREGWIPLNGATPSGSVASSSSSDEQAKYRVIATDWMGAAEMKKWLHQMQRVDVIMFFFCLADYDEVNPHNGINRLLECINWFEEVATNRWCRDTDLLIIFTRTDIAADKLRRVPFVRHFAAYDAPDTLPAVQNWVYEQCWSRIRRSGRRADSVTMYGIADDMTPTLTCLRQSWTTHAARHIDHH